MTYGSSKSWAQLKTQHDIHKDTHM